jgi:hypothetical protein
MANSRAPSCIEPVSTSITPARSGGPLGVRDAGDPNAMACMPGDTPGPLGSGWDAGDPRSFDEPNSCEMDVPVAVVDMDRIRHILYAVAYAEAANSAAAVGTWTSEVDLGDPKSVLAAADRGTDKLLEELSEAMKDGPRALDSFLKSAESRKQTAAEKLKKKLDEEMAAGRRSVERWGAAIKFCSNVKFVSTVTVKTLGVFTGWGGTGVDLVYSMATESQSIGESKGVAAVGITESGEAIVEELSEAVAELFAEKGLMTKKEHDQLQGWLGNYKGNAKKIHKQLAKLEQQIERRLKAGKSTGGHVRRRLMKLETLKRLRTKTAKRVLGSAGTYKKGLGKGLGKATSLVFLYNDVSDAWAQLQREHAAASR